MATAEEITRVLVLLGEAYDKPPKTGQAQVYLRALADISGALLEKAAMDHIASCPWFPKVSELRRMAEKIKTFNGRSVEYQDTQGPQVCGYYWQAMGLLSAFYRGEITGDQLEADPAWRWYAEHRELEPEESPAWDMAQIQAQESADV